MGSKCKLIYLVSAENDILEIVGFLAGQVGLEAGQKSLSDHPGEDWPTSSGSGARSSGISETGAHQNLCGHLCGAIQIYVDIYSIFCYTLD